MTLKQYQKINTFYYKRKTALIVNAHAKKVNNILLTKLIKKIPASDLYYSKSLNDSEEYIRHILKKGYGQIISGGGDGTLVMCINILKKISEELNISKIPKIGILSLGTGNAFASELTYKKNINDINIIIKRRKIILKKFDMVECDNGIITPFAGLGLDAEILNDYLNLIKKIKNKFILKITSSLFGYIIAFLFSTLPRNVINIHKNITISVKTNGNSFKIINSLYGDKLIPFCKNQIIYNGEASIVSISSIKYYGYGLLMFPFSSIKRGYLHLRIVVGNPIKFLPNIVQVWRGTYRNENIHDFIVKNVEIISSSKLPYQIGGDFIGYKEKVKFKSTQWNISMIAIQN